jgi:copper chaperone CopZ
MPKSTPIQFKVPDMDCQSCIQSIESAVHKLDPAAHVSADLDTKLVIIGTAIPEAHEVMEAIQSAGFEVEAA